MSATIHEIDPERCRFALEGLPKAGRVTVLPDYFVDRFVRFDSFDSLVDRIRTKSTEGGGGSVRGVRQSEIKGGNAVNVAYSLGKFGTDVQLVTIAESLAADTLTATFDRFQNVALEVIKGKPGYTVALEFEDSNRAVNVMVSDPGDLADFDGTAITDKTWKKIATSKIVAVLNWGSMKHGTGLCSKVFSFARERGAYTFLDPADVSELAGELPSLKANVFDRGLVDYLSLNENETRIICSKLFNHKLPQDYEVDELKRAVILIAQQLNCTVDIHTRIVSLSCRGSDCAIVACHKVKQKTVTGAGDVWDAADIVGRLLGWEPRLRLAFANASAGLYVSREDGEPPAVDSVLDFMTKNRDFY
jgi:ribokinase